METRLNEHKNFRRPSAITEHLIQSNHDVNIDNVDFLASGSHDTELLIKESLFVKRLRPNLNSNVSSYPLELF